MTTAFLYDSAFLKHNPGWTHPEKRQRLSSIIQLLQDHGLWDHLIHLPIQPAPLESIAAVHTPRYIEQFRAASLSGTLFKPDEVTIGSPGTFEAATMAAGAVLAALDAVMRHQVNNAFCAVRPPGHHAKPDQAMGFCFFNNVAIGAKYLQRHYGLHKIAIIDWDIHHGNGTQQVFYADPSVFYFSMHQESLFPHSGKTTETGEGPGQGFTLNVPLPPDVSDFSHTQQFTESLLPAMEFFKPDFILVSAGFDGHHQDSLSTANLTAQGFATLTEITMDLAETYCEGRLVSVLEGGYNPTGLAASVEAHIRALLTHSPSIKSVRGQG